MSNTDSGWRKRQIALDKKAENARELGLDYEPAPIAHIVGEIDHAGKVWTPAAQRKPLTVEEIWSAIRPLTRSDEVCTSLIDVSMDEYRAIEAAHGIKEKNT
jgi:hypothetical protein